ncbi:hypothetical protein SETIT_4G137100v2 [Setaria italica]|uniref:Uncharacterized protein n=1 Tax=Setaria italica TaxID=4555 RepID=A0A368QTX5_SETIT|nr:anthranilate O-methyltransferase 2 [Setaria italica]RCV21405.1 hypothetical protein SETIT_4G137100v2 [Setaria italica]
MGAKAAIQVNAYQILGDNSRPGFPFLSHQKRQKSHLIFLKLSQRRHEATELLAGHQPKLQRSTHVHATEVEHVFHMKGGNGETSYAKNSRLQRKAILETKPLLEMAIAEVCMSMTALPRTMVVADLGCSCGPNALLFVSEVICTVADRLKTFGHNPVEIQFFLNDLPGNDFNHVFRSLAEFHMCMAEEGSAEGGDELPAYYIAGLPGSFYRRLLPCRSVHLFHSSYCLMWCSQVPEELLEGKYVNEGKICIGATTPPAVVKLYQEQFHRDFSRFLELRSMELVPGGQMVLTILGRKHRDPRTGELFTLYALLAQALQCLLLEGRVEKEKLDGFNLPLYTPSVEEVAAAVEAGGLFDVRRVQLFQSNWDPHDDSEDSNAVTGGARESGENVARVTRAVLEALLVQHLGECVLDELFAVFARLVAAHLEEEKTKFTVVVLVLSLREGRKEASVPRAPASVDGHAHAKMRVASEV